MLIGSMKCGTTSLYRWLGVHPKIATSVIKEPEFFSENQAHKIKAQSYNDLFDIVPGKTLYTLDASTGYAKFPFEPNPSKRIFEHNKNSKIIYIVRNPFNRILSHYRHLKTKSSNVPNLTSNKLISYSNYYIQLEQYSKYFPMENILILDFENLKNNPREILKNVYNFLEIKDPIFPENYEVRNRTSEKPSLKQRKLNKKLKNFRHFIPFFLKRTLRQFLFNFPKKEIVVLSQSQKKIIYNELKTDMIKFASKYNFNVRKWGFEDIK